MEKPPMKPYPGKRGLDLLVSGTACIAFAPLIAGVALATCLEDGGRPLFSQPRLGQRRLPFTILKLRSMRGERVTAVGRWLRQTGIDEFPQFINVLRGDMSMVGPRPLTEHDVERLGWSGPDHAWRFAAKPGITGIAQLSAGHGVRESERFDKLYLEKQSLALDLQLLALSLAVNVVGKKRVRRWLRNAGALAAE